MARLNKKGETIVEVLISVAVVSATLAGAYYLANRSSQQTRAAVERAEALKAAESKVEILRSNLKNNITPSEPTGPYCVTPGFIVKPNPLECIVGTRYNVMTEKNGETYAVTATWDSILGSVDKLTIYYRP